MLRKYTLRRVSPSQRPQSRQVAGPRVQLGGMPSDVEYSPVGEGLGMRDFWLYVWLRRAAVIAAHVTGLGLTLIISLLSRPGTSEWIHDDVWIYTAELNTISQHTVTLHYVSKHNQRIYENCHCSNN